MLRPGLLMAEHDFATLMCGRPRVCFKLATWKNSQPRSPVTPRRPLSLPLWSCRGRGFNTQEDASKALAKHNEAARRSKVCRTLPLSPSVPLFSLPLSLSPSILVETHDCPIYIGSTHGAHQLTLPELTPFPPTPSLCSRPAVPPPYWCGMAMTLFWARQC